MLLDDYTLNKTCYIMDDNMLGGQVIQIAGNKELVIIKFVNGDLEGMYIIISPKDLEIKLHLWKANDKPLRDIPGKAFDANKIDFVYQVENLGPSEKDQIKHLDEGKYALVLSGNNIEGLYTGFHKTRGKPPMKDSLKVEPTTSVLSVDTVDTQAPSTPPPIKRFINVWLKDRTDNLHDPKIKPLEKDQVVTLNFDIDLTSRSESIVSNTMLNYKFPSGEDVIAITVRLETDDFDVFDEREKKLFLPSSGPSKNQVSFSIAPKHDGDSTVTVVFLKDGNFIQLITLKFDVGGNVPYSRNELGRDLSAAEFIQPRDINLTILNSIDGYQLILSGAVGAMATLSIKLPELKEMIREARQALMGIVNYNENKRFIFQDQVSIPEAVNQRVLPSLAEAGYRLYQRIFFSPSSDPNLQNLGNKLRKILQSEPCKIQVFSQDFVLPWGILYLADRLDRANIQPFLFLGLRHIIEHIPLQKDMLVIENKINSTSGLNVSLNVNNDIDKTMGPLVSNQEKYWEAIRLNNPEVKVTYRTTKNEVLTALEDPKASDQILYFYCHGVSQDIDETGGVDASTLILSGNDKLTIKDLSIDAPIVDRLLNEPLVFINACESAELSPLVFDGFVPYFVAKGARGVIGTECKVPAKFAVEWARRFFDRFLKGEALGEIFLALRQEFFNDEHNLLGLLYALYVDCDTRISPSIIRN